jgi:uncharacterized protein (DUF2062 family)
MLTQVHQRSSDDPVEDRDADSAAGLGQTLAERLRYGPKLPRSMSQAKRWLADHHMTLIAIADSPHSIALGSAIGIFFGFTPLASLKTLLSILAAWICRCNKIAAVIAVTVHDVLIFAMPAIYFAEYKLGCRILNRPPRVRIHPWHFSIHDYLSLGSFSKFIWPALIGSMFLAIPSGLIGYLLVRMLVSRSRSSRV